MAAMASSSPSPSPSPSPPSSAASLMSALKLLMLVMCPVLVALAVAHGKVILGLLNGDLGAWQSRRERLSLGWGYSRGAGIKGSRYAASHALCTPENVTFCLKYVVPKQQHVRSNWTAIDSHLQSCDADFVMGKMLQGRLSELASVSEPVQKDEMVCATGDCGRRRQPRSRPYLSTSGSAAALLVWEYMTDAGMDTRIDAVGNVIGLHTATPAPESASRNRSVLILGSHHDTVNDAGALDGSYGVLASIAVVHMLACNRKSRSQASDDPSSFLDFDIQVVAFDDEEGNNRFGTTNTGAKVFAGMLQAPGLAEAYLNKYPAFALALGDRMRLVLGIAAGENGDLAEVIRACGTNQLAIWEQSRSLGFVELHIEQGPVLDREREPAGVVSFINGQSRLTAAFTGRSAHAGTVPMVLRSDALVAAAKTVVAAESIAKSTEHLVATVGDLRVQDAASNTVPGNVHMTLDVRSPDDALRQGAVDKIIALGGSAAASAGVHVDFRMMHEAAAVQMDTTLQAVLQEAMTNVNTREQRSFTPRPLNSGAGHDAMIIANVTPVAMLFVRCKDGVSHHPDEYADPVDLAYGAHVLLESIRLMDAHHKHRRMNL
ncbi:Allantoate deiminase 1 [Porphyridium purpureum]|uniref:Allantoate deiminase 1 n=1 Tax=Porphyridium purpureum TaxID=35688 RepID=A0A5J4Z6K0_PORPP|nr:Allantoate deiminase 1 [Porphyridium purpureum]|eukprot:POR7502..scf295_1